jgi:hypothetical protein
LQFNKEKDKIHKSYDLAWKIVTKKTSDKILSELNAYLNNDKRDLN